MKTLNYGWQTRRVSSVFVVLLLMMGILLWIAPSAQAKGKGKGKGKGKSSALDGSKWKRSGVGEKETKGKMVRKKAKKVKKEKAEKAEKEVKKRGEKAEKAAKGKAKSPEDMKEVDKGSEKGKEMREQHSRKWWKLWGN